MDLLIKNGTLISSQGKIKADLAVDGEKISAVAQSIPTGSAKKVIDADGLFVLPGAIDAHTHLAMPFGGTISSDDYFAGTRAAACGGTTTVFDFAMQDFGEKLTDTVLRRNALAAPQAAVDYAFHVAIKDLRDDLIHSLREAVDFGVPSFKVFMVYDFGVSDGDMLQILQEARACGALISVHAENREVIASRVSQYLAEGHGSAWYHYLSRPEFVEAEADERAIRWAREADTPLYIVHLANREGVKIVEKARAEGLTVYAETCPQYLEFTCDVYKRPDGRNFVCSPPMKGQASQDELWAAINRGVISTIATDHCPFQSYEKDWGKDDFTKIPNGCAGVENMFPYMLSKAGEGRVSYEKVIELCCENPARIFGCQTKGVLAPGKDADIVLYDPQQDFTITQDKMHSDCDHTIWEGVSLHGYPLQTYSRGRLVYDRGSFVGQEGWGKLLKRRLQP
ncbi:dihydropyrimidinase [Oscillospiraceae bacterium HV4-5-C5C]|nr:dihydropyrimidinase [Oscillospiraceae bacterium HV4-5-C5C]